MSQPLVSSVTPGETDQVENRLNCTMNILGTYNCKASFDLNHPSLIPDLEGREITNLYSFTISI